MNENINGSVNESENSKDLITSEDVKKAISGDEQALIEQLERARQVALEQLEAKKNGVQTTDQTVMAKTEQELQAELAKREAELEIAKINAGLTMNQKVVPDTTAEEERRKKAQAAELEITSRIKPIDTTRNLYSANVETIKEKENQDQKIMQKKLKEQQALALKKQKEQEILAKKQLKEQKALEKKKAKEERKANSNFKYIMTIILFIGLFALVYFLPEISNYMAEYQKNKADQQNQLITTGDLNCKLSTYNKKYDIEYKSVFAFTDSKLTKLTYTAKTKGDISLDIDELTEMNEKCQLLKSQTKSLDGIVVKCSLNDGVNINIQELDYKYIDKEKVTTSYLEAGGTYPNYKYNDSIDKIEKEMNAAGYTCERTR